MPRSIYINLHEWFVGHVTLVTKLNAIIGGLLGQDDRRLGGLPSPAPLELRHRRGEALEARGCAGASGHFRALEPDQLDHPQRPLSHLRRLRRLQPEALRQGGFEGGLVGEEVGAEGLQDPRGDWGLLRCRRGLANRRISRGGPPIHRKSSFAGDPPLQRVLLCRRSSFAGDPPLHAGDPLLQETPLCRRSGDRPLQEVLFCRRSSFAGDPPLHAGNPPLQGTLLFRRSSFAGEDPFLHARDPPCQGILLCRRSSSAGDPPLQEILLCRRSSLSGDPPRLQEILLCRRSSSPLGKSSRRLVVTGGRGFYRTVIFIL